MVGVPGRIPAVLGRRSSSTTSARDPRSLSRDPRGPDRGVAPPVAVLARRRQFRAASNQVDTVMTGPDGMFSYGLPSGPSRTVTFADTAVADDRSRRQRERGHARARVPVRGDDAGEYRFKQAARGRTFAS
jgi:hypothetical protein